MRRFLPNRRGTRGSTLILVLMMLPLFLIPLVGLAIDGTMLFIVQTKLSSAADGAVLGAGRLLGTTANTTEIAGEFLNVNFPAGYWGSSNLQSNITSTDSLGTHTIAISTSVQVPLLFMRVLGQSYSIVGANATATRRDTRVVLILDRSGSMNTTDPISGLNVCTTMLSSAEEFTGMFTPGTDELGLVVLQGSALVAYPETRPYNNSPTSSGGPDTGFATSSTAGPMFTQISTIVCGGGTATPEALSLAYIELQKAHNRDLNTNGVDNDMNSIVLFTDGVADSIAVSPNSAQSPNISVVSSGSGCTYKSTTVTADTMMGWMAAPGNPPSWGTSQGLYLLSAYSSAYSLTNWLKNPTGDEVESNPTAAVSGCSSLGNNGNFTLNGLSKIPPYDIYGNSTSGNAYINSTLDYNGTAYNPNAPTTGYQVALAAWNATDNVGQTIRAQTAIGPITIYTIGYTGDGGTDSALLKRLANTQDSTSYNPSEQTGLYVQVDSADQLSSAFMQVASSMLRLSK
ncbi:MAG TPA: pilus assembly protein TadG-related protein [Bryobacteraceae bacterium]|nr:pilus assembly protein TadG-related protein [Bryobacteraceae bacterium]